MKNENNLENVRCPNCGHNYSFDIAGTTTFRVIDEGTEYHTDSEWDDDSFCACPQCLFSGSLWMFDETLTDADKLSRWLGENPESALTIAQWAVCGLHIIKDGHEESEDEKERVLYSGEDYSSGADYIDHVDQAISNVELFEFIEVLRQRENWKEKEDDSDQDVPPKGGDDDAGEAQEDS